MTRILFWTFYMCWWMDDLLRR